MYKRPHLQLFTKRIKEPRKYIQTIIGPRQVGKTTLMKQLIKEIDIPYAYLSADNVKNADKNWLEQQWEASRMKLKASGADTFLLIIDEVQKISDWSNVVKALWDYDSFNDINLKIILLGSSVMILHKGLSESLAGRFEIIRVGHWSYTEMEEAFGFSPEEFVWYGGYPGPADLIRDEERWKEYVKNALIETTISKDILMLTRVDKPALLKRVFELGTAYSGQILSFSKIVGQLQDAGNTTTISHYLELLDSAEMLCGLEKIYLEKIYRKSSSPKFQVKNTAFNAALSNYNFSEVIINPKEWGRIVESAIGAYLVNNSKKYNYKVYYWRHRNEEVDFVIQKGEKLIGIEVKSGKTKATSGMKAFKKKFNPDKILLIGTTGFHWKDFLKMEPKFLF